MAQRSIFIRDGYFGTDKSVAVMDTTPSGNEPAMVVRIIGSATIAGGGTSSNFTATFPPAGTAAGFTDGTDMQPATVYDLNTGGGIEYVLGASLRFSSGSGSVEAGTLTNPLRTDTTGTTTQPISAVSLPLPSGAATESTLATLLTSSTFTTRINTLGQKAMSASTPVVIASDQSTLIVDAYQAGTWNTAVSGTVTANQGGSWTVGGTGNFTVVQSTAANLNATVTGTVAATQSGTWTVQQGTPPWSMIGTKTNNVLASGANNIGVLPAIANSTLQSYTDGYQVALSVDASGSLRTVSSPISAFGWHIQATVHPIAQQHFTYGIQPRDTHTFLSSGSTAVGAVNGGSDMQLTTSTSNNAFAFARSFKALHYRAGVGTMALFTAAFNAGVANSQQIAGTWSPSAGYFVGFNGTTWGCFARIGGSVHVETLTVTTAATSASNVTVTIDGTAVVVAVTNQTGNPTRTAWEISQADYSAAGGAGTWGWDAFALGAVVYFVARRARAVAGTFSFSAGTTGSAATMAVVKAGADVTDDFGSPATPGNWTFLDALDGTGPSGLNLDKTKAIIYGISIGHLGHRGARMSVSHPVSGQMFIFADYRYMNTSKFSALTNPTLYVAWGIQSNGSTTAMTLTAGSGMGGIEGELDENEGEHWSVSASKTATNNVVCHYLSIRNGPITGFGTTRASRAQVKVNKLIVSVGNAATGNFVDVQVLRNPTLTNLANFTQVDNTRLALWTWQDTTTTTAVASGGTVLLDPRVFVNTVFQIDTDIIVLEPGELVSVTIAPSTSGITVDVTMFGVEIQ